MKAITERHVQAIWYDPRLRPADLHTCEGNRVSIISPGEWNLQEGPDFRGAVLEVGSDRRRLSGDVEVHLCPTDWDLHGHGSDPNYRNVIAHVTWSNGPRPASLPAEAISIWLGRFVLPNAGIDPEAIDLSAYPYGQMTDSKLPCEEMLSHDPDEARRMLGKSGERRLRMKAMRLAGRLCERPGRRQQIFYEEMMAPFGYHRNSAQFRHIAERVPIENLLGEKEVACNALRIASRFEEWDQRGCRPNNRPEVRLAAAAEMFAEGEVMELLEARKFDRGELRGMMKALGKWMGGGRAAAVIANVIVPFALAEDRIRSIPDWLPPEEISAPVRLIARRMFGRDHNPAAFYARNGLTIQGLLFAVREWCASSWPWCGQITPGITAAEA